MSANPTEWTKRIGPQASATTFIRNVYTMIHPRALAPDVAASRLAPALQLGRMDVPPQGRSGVEHLRATDNLAEDVVAMARRTPIRRGEGAVGRMAVTREPVQIPDMSREGAYQGPLRDTLLRLGTRALLAVPLLQEDHLVGGLGVTRTTPGECSPEII